jgi:DUF1680 family protein/inosine-uridine nucleoside N-ribohydrolase
MKALSAVLPSLVAALSVVGVPSVEPLPDRVPARLPDLAEMLSPAAIHLDGWLGARVLANATNRLMHVDTEPLLAGFRNKPGSHPWIGEHIGKWMHAATLAWAYTGDPALRAKLDRAATELIATQEPDGYLGTYLPGKRFGLERDADWDVWSHKYNLIGLLTYHRFTGNEAALNACRKMGDLLITTFPAKKSILAAGTHKGMAATSVLEPMVLLYRATGDEHYLDFARYIVKSWDEPGGPKIIQTLLQEKQVNKTANGKAYEMLSNLVGLCELARATGERNLLEPVLNAWQDIVSKRLYLTGSASQGEHFRGDFELPNDAQAHVAETCVTTTWIQLNLQLLRLTGEARFADELEKTIYNHLAAAQLPRGDDWCYFTALQGRKPYTAEINCCHSSGPRGMALAPLQAYLKTRDDNCEALAVSTFESSSVSLSLDGTPVTVVQKSEFPFAGKSELRFQLVSSAKFAVRVRVPAWAAPLRLKLNGRTVNAEVRAGWASLPPRSWKDGDHLAFTFNLAPRLAPGDHGNAGFAALTYGPFVMAFDAGRNPKLSAPATLAFTAGRAAELRPGSDGLLALTTQVSSPQLPRARAAKFVSFADAGVDGGEYRVWLRAPGNTAKAAPTPVILDTDIGDDIDDTWALGLLLKSPELDLKLVVGDRGAAQYRARLLAKLLERAGRSDVPVGVGLDIEPHEDGRQAAWVKDYDLKNYPGKVHADGVQAIIDTIMKSKKPVTLICIGPVPNIGEALKREPRIAKKARFVGMHGSVRVGYGGDKKPAPEWNVKCNPKACQAVFTAPWDMTITPLDTCGLVTLTGEKYRRVRDSHDRIAADIIANYRLWAAADPKSPADMADTRSSTLFDTVAVYLAVRQDLCVMEKLGIRVTDDGMTVIDPRAKKINVATGWKNLGGFEDFLVERLAGKR